MCWQPSWPPIQISADEWIIVRETPRQASAVVRRFETVNGAYFRVVTWSERSEDRVLVGRFPSLDEADQAVMFPVPSAGPSFAGYPSADDLAWHPWKLTEDVHRFHERNAS